MSGSRAFILQFARYWVIRGLAAVIGLASIYIALQRVDLSNVLLIPLGIVFAVYGFLGRDVLNRFRYSPGPTIEQDDVLPDPIELTVMPIDEGTSKLLSHFPTYWALGQAGDFACWKWSNTSQAHAQEIADRRAAELLRMYKENNDAFPNHYLYSDRKMREAVVRQIGAAVISRNAYGAQILNTESVMFADIDFPEDLSVGKRAHFVEQKVAFLGAWISSRPSWGLRIYRTAGGLRLLATGDLFDPCDPQVDDILTQLGTDPLYRKLCRVQETFRARLTPKPWRCEWVPPPRYWPFRNEKEENTFKKWLGRYELSSQKYAVCRLVVAIGVEAKIPEIVQIQNIHDYETKCDRRLPLA
jgi:hypothetical protein